jgi:hypothetical protein
MKTKLVILGFIAFWPLISCTERVMEPLATGSEQITNLSLKSASINYYVATNGSDNNPGTSASPFKTIQKAASVVNPGDTVIVRDGVYTTSSQYTTVLSRSGTAGNYITFRSEHKYGAVLDGNNVSSYCFSIGYGSSYVTIQDFEIKNFLWTAIDFGMYGYTTQYITIKGNKIHDIGRVEDSGDYGRDAIYTNVYCHHITVTQNLIYNIGRTGPNTYWLNKDHAIYFGAKSGSDTNHDNVVTYNIIYSCSGSAITSGSDNDLFANNVIGWSNYNSQGGGALLAIDYGVVNLTIANNIFLIDQNCDRYAIWNSFGSLHKGWSVKNNMIVGGRMWDPNTYDATSIAAMDGSNYGQTDCENAEVNPLLVSATRGSTQYDFSLQSNSPAIDKGASVGLTSDFLKNAIIGLPDNGAYEYQGNAVETQTIYYNINESGTATKNDCGTGYTGSTVTYTVAAGKYSSTISQTDANNQAINDVNTNKQAYANANGTCTAPTVYYNVQQSGTATKNDCGTGYTGSTVTYTVAAGRYSSTISQADANNQAITDVNNNKQAYANANGTCTAPAVYYNVQESGTATKNDCGTGYAGSTVTYTVAAATYTSTVSQTDANNLAIADVNNNKQAYANANGTCTPKTVTVTSIKSKKWWRR